MRRLAWFAGPLLLLGGCGDAPTDAPLPTYTGAAVVEDEVSDPALYVEGTLELREGCLAVAIDQDEDGEIVHAMLRLPADGGAELEWRGDELWFHDHSYALGSTLVFRATVAPAADLSDVPEVCRDLGLDVAVSAVPATTDLALDPAALVIGHGDQLRVPVAELSNGGMDAAMRSDLAVVGESCLGVEAPGTDTLLVWPFGTTVSYDPDPVVLLPDGKTYAVGDRLDLGGGYVYEPESVGEPQPQPIEGLPAECQGLGRFLVSPF